ncbi:MAG: transcription-repair coupling factor [Ethanoligenens sp.]
MQFLADIFRQLPAYRDLEASVKAGVLPVAVTGLAGVHKAQLVYALCRHTGRRALLLAADEQEAARMRDDLDHFFGGGILLCPARDLTLRPVESVSREFEHERLRVLGRMAAGDYQVVIACADAAMQLTMPKEIYQSRSLPVESGKTLPPQKAVDLLLAAGYVRTEQVEGMGQFAMRGGILDFFPPQEAAPVRVEFWGDEPDTVMYFDPETQRRTEPAVDIRITPAVEIGFAPDDLQNAIRRLLDGSSGKARASFEKDLERLESGIAVAATDRYLSLCYTQPASLFDYADDALLFVSESARVRDRAKNTLWQSSEDVSALLAEGILAPGLDTYYLEWPQVLQRMDRQGAVLLDTFARASYETTVRGHLQVVSKQFSLWSGGVALLKEDLMPALDAGGRAVVLAGTAKNSENLAKELSKEGIAAAFAQDEQDAELPMPGTVLVLPGRLSAGLAYPDIGFSLFSYGGQASVTGQRLHRKRKSKHAGERIRSLAELSPGDYVVHSAHGIGVYEGIHKLTVQGVIKDYIKIRYAGKDTLYVPVTQLDLVSKYIGTREDGHVRLNKMGGTEWQKAKNRVRAAVKDMAKELIALYAARQQVKGVTFQQDDAMQREFEDRFEFDETDDQLRCVEEIKGDMQRPFPMDRLLCGDVGFGKTEVALRAAFKCVENGRQCAILVPTTILAWQHYQTITRRMEGFPVRLGLLSRFRTPHEQQQTLREMAQGSVDIVVGTHRLVQKDIRFKSLGLLVVDEEQRFGVAQKEKLKELFKNVDVLTLSATPIPRTLNMAMSGIRDMSVIEEAPQDRHPVQTYVLEHDWGVLADAVHRELRRGGQVYYLHNRVESIESTAAKLHTLIPDARVGVAHGKMDEDTLSRVWEKLLGNELDVLVCTTIIETGVDVPNCNTLIIEDADHMGLSQLHQIRGRVGRSTRRAFAYFTFRRGKALSDIATKRLEAIREYTEFGAGFQIALRDLEIRGAGNILGSQQHGHMESVGYDMYLKLLSDAVLEEKGEKPAREEECMVDIQISAHIPESYIASAGQRLETYRRIADIRSTADESDVLDELIDRYGDPPDAVRSLVDVALLRNTAAALGIREIAQRENVLMLYATQFDMQAVSRLVGALRGRVMVNAGQKPYISVKMKTGQSPIDGMRETLGTLLAKPETAVGGSAKKQKTAVKAAEGIR